MLDKTQITLAIVASMTALGVLLAAITVLLWRRWRDEHGDVGEDVDAAYARIEALEQLVADLAGRVAQGEHLCDGWHDVVREDRLSVQGLLGRVDELELALPEPPAATSVAIGPAPMLVDLVEPEPAAFFNQMAMPALTEPTGYVPILPVTAAVAPIDNTETAYTRETVREVLARLADVEIVDARELAEVTA